MERLDLIIRECTLTLEDLHGKEAHITAYEVWIIHRYLDKSVKQLAYLIHPN